MTSEISNFKSAIIIWLALSAPIFAGLRIDLRPTPPVPPSGYQPNTLVDVDFFLVDTGNPQGAIQMRGVFLDFFDSPPWGGAPGTLTYPDPDGPGSLTANEFNWFTPFTICFGPCGGGLPLTAWVYPLPTPNPLFQITMPDNGEVQIGELKVNVGASGGILDATNHDNPDINFGARVDFGFGGPNDPVTTWRAFTGDITGGVLELPVIPEPASLLLLSSAAVYFGLFRKGRFAQSRQAAR